MPHNIERARWASAAVYAHRQAKDEHRSEDDAVDTATDLVTDLCHYIYRKLLIEPYNMKAVEAENEVKRLINDRCFDGFLEELLEEEV